MVNASQLGNLAAEVFGDPAHPNVAIEFTRNESFPPPLNYRVDGSGRTFDLTTGKQLAGSEINRRWSDLNAGLLLAPSAPNVNTAVLTNWTPTAPAGWQWIGPQPSSSAPNPAGTWIGPDGVAHETTFGNYPWANVPAGTEFTTTVPNTLVPPADPLQPSPVAIVPPPPPPVGAVPSPVLLAPRTLPNQTPAGLAAPTPPAMIAGVPAKYIALGAGVLAVLVLGALVLKARK